MGFGSGCWSLSRWCWFVGWGEFLVVIVKGCVSEVSVCLVGAEFCFREEVGS